MLLLTKLLPAAGEQQLRKLSTRKWISTLFHDGEVSERLRH